MNELNIGQSNSLEENKEVQINTDFFNLPYSQFDNHLLQHSNRRVIFSGKYGVGKSTFLNYYFTQRNVKEKYVSIHISPVNYVVSSNQDIFELIKFDVLLGLFEKDTLFESAGFNDLDELKSYLSTKYLSLFSKIIDGLGLLGSDVIGDKLTVVFNLFKFVIDNFDSIYKDYRDDTIQLKGEVDEVDDFVNSVVNKIGSSYDESIITNIIAKKIQELKNGGKEAVLVIDDLDRLDPEHIFRIINIFGCHLDYQKNKDSIKFGFDKIILVCDINNIKVIFQHKYGRGVDFFGYIDKFYSKSIFCYLSKDLYTIVTYFTSQFRYSISTSNPHYSSYCNQNEVKELVDICLTELLVLMLKMECISIRSLSKMINECQIISIDVLGKGSLFDENPVLVIVIYICEIISGSLDLLKELFKNNYQNPYVLNNANHIISVINNSGVALATIEVYENIKSGIPNQLQVDLSCIQLTFDIRHKSHTVVVSNNKWNCNALYLYFIILEKIEILKWGGYRNNALNNYKPSVS